MKGRIEDLVQELAKLPTETEWLEFKRNNASPEEIGENISAISNACVLHDRAAGYILWGVDNKTHKIIGTTFRPRQTKKGNEEFENWLLTQLDPRINVDIREGEIDGARVVLFEIQPAHGKPVGFKGVEYIRIGSYTKKLRDHPEKERALWRSFDRVPFEDGIVMEGVSPSEVLDLLDWQGYFRLMEMPFPRESSAVLNRLASDGIITVSGNSGFDITNVGGILFARNLSQFARLSRKSLRVILYRGESRIDSIREQVGVRGYAVGFEGAIGFIHDLLPQNEQIGQALRKEVRMYPEIAVRELVANAVIHQDFGVTGAGPMVEIFTDRLEISNPGNPLIDTLRFLDEPPLSRNERLASMMRRMGVCEERGSGIDKVIANVELFQLPAPDFRVSGASTVAVLYGPRRVAQMDRPERVRACYQHACLQYVSGKRMSNASLRKRLGILDSNYPQASRIIRDTINEGLIRPYGVGTSEKSYIPFWA